MVGNTHAMILGRLENKISQIIGISFAPKQKINLPSLLLYR